MFKPFNCQIYPECGVISKHTRLVPRLMTDASSCSSLTHERLLSQLSQCEFSIAKSQLGWKMNETELENYETLYKQIDAGTEAVKAEIGKAKEELSAAKQVCLWWPEA